MKKRPFLGQPALGALALAGLALGGAARPARAQYEAYSTPVGGSLSEIVADPVANTLCLADNDNGALSLYDTSTDAPLASAPYAHRAFTRLMVNPNTSRIMMLEPGDGYIQVRSSATLGIVDTVWFNGLPGNPPAGADNAVLDPTTNTVFITNARNHLVEKVSMTDRKFIASATLESSMYPVPLAVDASAHRVFTSCAAIGKIAVIDSAAMFVTGYYFLPPGSRPTCLCYDSHLNALFTGNSGTHDVSKINLNTGAVTTIAIPHATPADITVDPSDDIVFVSDSANDCVDVVDGAAGVHVLRVALAAGTRPLKLALDAIHSTLYTANSGNGTYSVLSSAPSAPNTFALSDVVAALREAAGIYATSGGEKAHLNADNTGSSAGFVDLQDAARMLRKISGLDP